MEFVQSRFQDVFSRFYEAIFDGIGYLVGVVLYLYLFTDKPLWTDSDSFGALFYAVISIGPICYLLYKYKDGAKRLCLNEDTFSYRDGEKVTEFDWQEYQGYKITRIPPYRVIVRDNIYDNTSFSYYAFSPQQRQQIFAILDTKSQAVS